VNDFVCTVCATPGSLAEAVVIADYEGKRRAVRCCSVCLALVPDFIAEWAAGDNLERQITFHEEVLWNETTAEEMLQAAADLTQTVQDFRSYFGDATQDRLVCDIGAGRASLTQALIQSGYRVLACEPAPGLVRLAREHYGLGEDVLLEMTWEAFLEWLDTHEIRPDAFVLWHVLEHVDNPIELLRALRARLSLDGRIVLQLPLLYGPYVYPEHNFFLTAGGLARVASAAGLDLESTDLDLDNLYFTAALAPGETRPFSPAPDGVARCLAECVEILEKALLSRSEACNAQALLIEERYRALEAAAALTDERDATIATQAQVLDERWEAMTEMEEMIRERDATIAAQEKMLDERWEAMSGMDRMIQERDGYIAELEARLTEREAPRNQ
jgi:SAM-dependent methyltransferase